MEKKNTILLTVIAVATLLVAVVGATFAYFTAQGGTTSQANVTVSTGTAGSSSLGTFSAINIYADATTFSKENALKEKEEEGLRAHTGTSTGTVSWTAPGAVGGKAPSEADRSFCYTAVLNITANTFEATQNAETTELEFTAKKDDVVVIDKMNITTTTTDVKIPTKAVTAEETPEYVHKLVPAAGATDTDTWTLTVTLLNLNADQSVNAGKQFTGAVKFDKVNCQ